MTRTYAAMATAFIVALLGGLFALVLLRQSPADAFAPCRGGQVAGGTAAIGGPFTLTDPEGRSVSERDVLAKPALIYFGYTFCPDVCPFDMARNVAAVDLLAARGISVTPVFITVDPERDTGPVLAEWAAAFHPRLLALGGSPEQIRTAAKAYKVYYQTPSHAEGEEFYPVDHSAFTYLMLPETGFADFFRREATAEQMADSVACFIDAS